MTTYPVSSFYFQNSGKAIYFRQGNLFPARQSISGKAALFPMGRFFVPKKVFSLHQSSQELKLSGIKSLRNQVSQESSLSGTKLSGLQGCKSDLFLASSLNQNRFSSQVSESKHTASYISVSKPKSSPGADLVRIPAKVKL